MNDMTKQGLQMTLRAQCVQMNAAKLSPVHRIRRCWAATISVLHEEERDDFWVQQFPEIRDFYKVKTNTGGKATLIKKELGVHVQI